MASMRGSETQEQALERLEQKRTRMASMRASETSHVKLHKKRKNKEAMVNARTKTVPVEGAIAAFHSEVKLRLCTSVLRIVLHYIIINFVYIESLYTIFRIAHQSTFILHVFINTDWCFTTCTTIIIIIIIINAKCVGTRPWLLVLVR